MKYILPLIAFAAPAFADAPVIENVAYSGGRFDVTLSHGDTGWDDYADGWRIELEDGTILGTRVLAHPQIRRRCAACRPPRLVLPGIQWGAHFDELANVPQTKRCNADHDVPDHTKGLEKLNQRRPSRSHAPITSRLASNSANHAGNSGVTLTSAVR